MDTNFLEGIQGEKIEIIKMTIFCVNEKIELSLSACCNNDRITMTFYNVSRLHIQNLSVPMEIHGFEIICNKQNGWERDSNYMVRDFEDGRILFFCEEISFNGVE